MAMYKLAIVGRPNVGKSALFNRICKKRIAIVDEAEGITRDRLYAEADYFGVPFQIIDTGGIDPSSADVFQEEIRRQAHIAMQEADTIVMVVDATVGLTALDEALASYILGMDKPVVLAVNKVDSPQREHLTASFYKLGITKVVPISALHGGQIAELLDLAWEGFELQPTEKPDTGIQIALVGRPNVGKSTLVNTLVGSPRCVVSPVAGTTRDHIDIPFSYADQKYTLIDTAGIRKKQSEKEVVDKFAFIRTKEAIERCDICLLMLEAESGLTAQDKKIATLIEQSGKGCVVILNKWDLVKGFRMEHCIKAIHDQAPFLAHCPILCISAQTGRKCDEIFEAIQTVYTFMGTRIPTAQLNNFVSKAMQLCHPPMIGGKRLRIYYLTQVETSPPRFTLFVNYDQLMSESYRKYLMNQFRKQYAFTGVPLNFYLRSKKVAQSDPNE
jgi:GTP-binding protein